MKNLDPTKKKPPKEDNKIFAQDQSNLIADFFNDVLIELKEE